jgi:glycosyltransferase involved in cell wall biosynthesis
MRILIVTDWNRNHGGAEAYVGWLRDGLRKAGDEVKLLTSTAGSAANGAAEYKAFGTENKLAQAFLQVANPFAAGTVRKAIRDFRPDLIFVNMFAHHLSPAVFAVMGGVPVVLSVSDYKCVCPIGSKLLPNGSICTSPMGWVCHQSGCLRLVHWMRDRPRYAFIEAAVARADRVIACSAWVQRELAVAGIESECELLPVPAPSPSYVRRRSPDPTILYCGRFDVEKGIDDLMRAFAAVVKSNSRAKLRLAGRGPEEQKLKDLAASLGIAGNVEFAGWLDPDGIEGELSAAWALCAPSRWAEPLGLVAPEAIVHGVPVVASASGGFAETVIERETGMLFPNGDVPALSTALLSITERRSFVDGIQEDAITRLRERHDMERYVTRLHAILDDTVRSRRAGVESRLRAVHSH